MDVWLFCICNTYAHVLTQALVHILYTSQWCRFQNICSEGYLWSEQYNYRKGREHKIKKIYIPFRNGGEGMRTEKVIKKKEVKQPGELWEGGKEDE